MTEDNDTPDWPTNPMKLFQEVGEQATRQQQEMFRRMLNADADVPGGPGGAGGFGNVGGLGSLGSLGGLSGLSDMATFKTRIQSGGRISIPDAEREALDIGEGDIVQTIVVPVKRNRDTDTGGSDTRGSDTRGSDTRGSDTRGSDTPGRETSDTNE